MLYKFNLLIIILCCEIEVIFTSANFQPKVSLFSSEKCDGEYIHFPKGASVPDLSVQRFDDLARSVYIAGPWTFFELKNFNEGISPMEYIFEPTPRCVNLRIVAGHVSSLRSIGDQYDFSIPSITIFTSRDFQGQAEYVTSEKGRLNSFENQRSLIITGDQPWTIFDAPWYGGRALCLIPERSDVFRPALIPQFSEFEPPIPIGSIASVYKGCAKNAERVIIKRRKPSG